MKIFCLQKFAILGKCLVCLWVNPSLAQEKTKNPIHVNNAHSENAMYMYISLIAGHIYIYIEYRDVCMNCSSLSSMDMTIRRHSRKCGWSDDAPRNLTYNAAKIAGRSYTIPLFFASLTRSRAVSTASSSLISSCNYWNNAVGIIDSTWISRGLRRETG